MQPRPAHFRAGTLKRAARSLAFVVILLAVLLPEGGPPATAYAQSGATVDFNVSVAPRQELLKKLCVGETLDFYIAVERHLSWIRRGEARSTFDILQGPAVGATVTNPQIGTIQARLGSLETDQSILFTKSFVFTAKKAGATQVTFSADIRRFWVGNGQPTTVENGPIHKEANVVVTVQKCKAKVNGVYRWSGDGYLVMGTLDETEVEANDEGVFAGDGTLTWVAHSVTPNCTSTDSMAPSQVHMTGQMDEDGDATFQFDFEPVPNSVTLYCEEFGIVTADTSFTAEPLPEPIEVSVPAEGGVVMRDHGLVNTSRTETVPGQAVVVIIPEGDEAVSSGALSMVTRQGLGGPWRLWPGALLAALSR